MFERHSSIQQKYFISKEKLSALLYLRWLHSRYDTQSTGRNDEEWVKACVPVLDYELHILSEFIFIENYELYLCIQTEKNGLSG